MESTSNHKKYSPSKKLKQVKVDNWGTFFLQRLLQLYFNEELLDFNIKFHSNDNVLKVHKLVITTCTDYFVQLEREQIEFDSTTKNMIIMPSDMPYECVKSIISFMYTGQLEYWTSEQNALYYTAQKMKMSVLTKLLDAQSNINVSKQKADDLTSKQAVCVTSKPQTYINNELPSRFAQNIEEKKFATAKRKVIETIDFTTSNNNFEVHNINDGRRDLLQSTEGPSRFDLPEIEDLTLGVFSSFDDITYNTKPIVQAPERVIINYKDNLASISNNVANMVVKIDSNFSYVEVENEDLLSSEDEWINLQPNIKKEQRAKSPLKKLRFDFDEKENLQKSETNHVISSNTETVDSVDNHAKIIREVLKNYPHLVQHNKNIRLKIMQKESKNNECSSGKTKVSYVVLKSDSLMVNNAGHSNTFKDLNDSWFENNENGPWKCAKCNLNEQYTVYCMYRSHMQDVHGEKFDPRICEHCGYKATKRNILMYHMYTKHNVPPPKSMSFPRCHLCSYVALSESLLTRHLNNHKHENSKIISSFSKQQIICYECEKRFPDTATLINHEIITGHKNPEKSTEEVYLCLHCGKRMANAFTLQVHEECYHKHAFQLSYSQSKSIISNQLLDTKEIGVALNTATRSSCENNTQQIIKTNQKLLENESNISSIPNLEDKQQAYEIMINNERFQRQMPTPLTVCLNGENEHRGMQSFRYGNYQHSQQNDEIVEEVVEELETVDIEKCRETFCKDQQDTQIQNIYKNVKNNTDDQKDCLFNSENAYSNFNEISEIVTYVEEETEILEYETINNI